MNISPWTDVQFDDEDSLEDFRFVLQLAHDRIAQVLFSQNKVYQTYPLVDNTEHNKDWQQNLQAELTSIYSRIGITGLPDFAGADLNKEDDFNDFMLQLQLVERRINTALGIS